MKSFTGVVVAMCLPAAAFAQGRIEGVYCNGSSATGAVFDPNIGYGSGNLGGPVGDGDMDNFGLNKSASINFNYDEAPYSGRMGGHSNISYGPDASPGIGGNFSDIYFDGSTFSNTSGGQDGFTGNFSGNTIVSMYFTVDQATSWNWAAGLDGFATGDAQATYQMFLQGMAEAQNRDGSMFAPWGDFLAFDAASAEQTGSFDLHADQSGILDPGTYWLRVEIYSNSGLWQGPGTGEASVTIANGLFHLGGPVPAPAASGLLLLAGLTASGRKRRA